MPTPTSTFRGLNNTHRTNMSIHDKFFLYVEYGLGDELTAGSREESRRGTRIFFQAQGHTSKDTPTHCSLLEVLSAYLRAGSSVFLGRRACCQECETSRRTFHKPAHGGCCNVQTLATDMTQGERRRISSHSGHTTPWSIPKHHGGCTPETPTLNVDFASGTT